MTFQYTETVPRTTVKSLGSILLNRHLDDLINDLLTVWDHLIADNQSDLDDAVAVDAAIDFLENMRGMRGA
jgi:hypothetical protein